MRNPHGSFIWYELLTSDTAAAGRFYADVLGWQVSAFEGAKGRTQARRIGDPPGPEGVGLIGTLLRSGCECIGSALISFEHETSVTGCVGEFEEGNVHAADA